MSKILIIAAVFPPEPVVSAKLAYELACALSNSHEVTVLCPKPTRPYGFDFSSAKIQDEKFKRIEMKTYTCPQYSLTGRFRENCSFGIETAKYLHDHHHEIDAIFAHPWPLFGQYIIVRAAKKYNLPIALHIQDIYPQSLANKLGVLSSIVNFLLLPIDKSSLKKASAIIVISDHMKEYFAKTREISKDKISVVLNWQDEATFLKFKDENEQVDKFTFMYLGNIGPVAGVDLLIDGFIMANIPNSRLVIAGSGSMKAGLIKRAAIHPEFDIQFWDIPDGKVPENQSKANVMLLPIKKGAASSSIPSKLPAYMFSAKPVICCADADSYTAECIRRSKCGYVVEPENCNELSNALISIAKQTTTDLHEMGERGCKYALGIFSKEVNLNRLITVVSNQLNT